VLPFSAARERDHKSTSSFTRNHHHRLAGSWEGWRKSERAAQAERPDRTRHPRTTGAGSHPARSESPRTRNTCPAHTVDRMHATSPGFGPVGTVPTEVEGCKEGCVHRTWAGRGLGKCRQIEAVDKRDPGAKKGVCLCAYVWACAGMKDAHNALGSETRTGKAFRAQGQGR
jgi:hypothetical protein